MVKYVLISIFIVIALLGLSEFLHIIKMRFSAPLEKAFTCCVLFLTDDMPERQIAFAAEQRMWLGKTYADKIIAVENDISEENLDRCRIYAKENDVILCGFDELSFYLKGA